MTEDQHINRSLQLERSRELRRAATPAERDLWKVLRNRQCGGLKFRRQETVGPYIVDFLCLERMLVIELDGPSHDGTAEYDEARTRFLRSAGLIVVRFTNEDVYRHIEAVVQAIIDLCERKDQ